MSFVSGKMGQFRYFDQQLGHPDWASKTVLDFGGNSGNLLRDPLASIDPALYWCIDVSPAGIARGQDTFPQAHWIRYDRYNFEFNPRGVKGLEIPDPGQRFDVILCDLMMPDVTGMDFYQELYVLDPDQAGKVMFMTGGAYSDRAREFLARVPNMRIDKPFDIGQLRAMVRARVKQQQQQRGKSGAA